ncbi:dynamin family protein [Acinetobacter sp. SwsAc4]|uniref:dynamin family protein n=1 Tax=Acinetobacter sp. SwsAc4 TaxID=2749437 RepID=UPI0015BE05AE|nr:dynamin family protein [Acinetobacter sp. SwsAc4]NWK82586.1 dynamin family protein [Acinetobacter sp. SwsAc4]
MSYQEDFDIAQRYDLLCRASQSHVEQDGQGLQLAADLDVLDKIINHDLPELARSGSPDHFADILKSLNLELEHFREFCEFPDLAQKVVVGVGGAFSAGKSSLINTLLGKKRLVVEIDPTTSLPTYLLHGKQEQITALNLFRRRVILSQDEFASLTHEEKIKYGSQIAGLLRSAFVSDPDFAWKNIALLDTPGYSKPDSEQWSERTDESVARSQLNLSNFIIWVVSATQGTISEDDLKFLTTLNADIPKLIVVSRADAKTPEDIAKIVALVKQTVAERGVNVLDVIPVSARKKNDYPVQPVVSFLEKWNEQTKGLSFAQNFKKKFVAYSQFVQGKQQQAKTKLEQINKLLFLSDHPEQISIIEKLQHIEKDSHKEWDDLAKNLEELQHQFFNKMNQLADLMGGYQEQLLDVETLLKDPHCSAEILQSYAERLNDEKLLNIIYQHENCPIKILENLINKPIGSLTVEQIEVLLSVELIYQDSRRIYEHLEVIPIDNLSVTTRLKISLSNHIKTKTQIKLSQDLDVNVRKNLAKNSNIVGLTHYYL